MFMTTVPRGTCYATPTTDVTGYTALLLAADNGHLPTVQSLLASGGASIGETSSAGDTALLLAASNGNLLMVQWLLTSGGACIAETSTDGFTALLLASYNGHLSTVQWLIREGGSSSNESDSDGDTALLLAVCEGHLPIVQWLLTEGGSSITEANSAGSTAFLTAVHRRYLPLVQWLLVEGGASIADATFGGHNFYDHLSLAILHRGLNRRGWYIDEDGQFDAQLTSLLKVIALLDRPPRVFTDELSPHHRELLARGARIRAQRARCLASRAAAIRGHCQLLPGLVDVVVAFAEPSIDDLYEVHFFTQRRWLRMRGHQAPLRRSLRLRQKIGWT